MECGRTDSRATRCAAIEPRGVASPSLSAADGSNAHARARACPDQQSIGAGLEEVATHWPAELALWRARDPHWVAPGGESAQQLIDRTLAALREVAQQWTGKTVLLIVHGGVLDAAYRHAQNLAWNAPRQHLMLNTAVNHMRATATPWSLRVVGWGDVAHLESDPSDCAGPALEGSAP